ncbi:cytochrome c553 [Pseudorhizobium tarimense]|uniref:Cytochrome c553 n=1 Tax=Pseudorhizobium tarimense TaxID=1079109 RepID=A0ABV2H978_9HYPH|nr:c-type cytochrome [Pseudorhizobium tarimense]MCJ8520141.1 c-type cytochrome [Pseudorhizobium tarimense]
MIIRLKHLVVAVIAIPFLALLIGWSGLIGVGASSGHWAITDWFLHWVMRNSTRTAALSIEAPPLEDSTMLPPAAGHYEMACAMCHGSPVTPRPELVRHMLPVPPDLGPRIPTWTDEQLFQIVQHGVRFTGMPAWPTQKRPDEVWAMVAFLRQLPGMSADRYYELSGLYRPPMEGEVDDLPLSCESCHSARKVGPGSLVPSLAGQSEEYLLESLKAYANNERPSGIMQMAISLLPNDSFPELAHYYATQTRPQDSAAPVDADLVERGRILAQRGRSEDKIPACLSCHEKPGSNPVYPRISGLSQPYLERQLHLFNEGIRGGTEYSHVMREAANYLEDDDIVAAAAYFAQRQE